MPDRISLLIKVFRVELEETENDILMMLEYYSKRFSNHEITPYVWMENRALLQKEMGCIRELEQDLAEWPVPEGLSAREVLPAVREYLKDIVRERGYPELVTLVIDRIGGKISRYLD